MDNCHFQGRMSQIGIDKLNSVHWSISIHMSGLCFVRRTRVQDYIIMNGHLLQNDNLFTSIKASAYKRQENILL